MKRINFLFLLFIYSIFLFLYNALALKLHLFWISPWLDAPSHVLGGLVSALFVAYFIVNLFSGIKESLRTKLIYTSVFIIGILWEIFEAKFGITFPEKSGYWFDTNFDMVCDIFGAFLANRFLIKKYYAG